MAKIIRSITSVLFGSWPQADGTVKPIEWQVLKQEGNKALLCSKNILITRRFDSKSNVWKNSEIRYWLNNEFLNAAFTEADKTAILETELPDVVTTDKVFLPSHEEAKMLFKFDEASAGKKIRREGRSLEAKWWLRSQGYSADWEAFVIRELVYVNKMLNFVKEQFDVCPALWVNLDSDIFKS